MALFKILRGNKSALATAEKQDGWAYFTPDTKGFYIQANDQLLKINDRMELCKFNLEPYMLSNGTSTIDLSLLDLSITPTKNLYQVELIMDHDSAVYNDPQLRFLATSVLEKANLHYDLTADNRLTIMVYGRYDANAFSQTIPMILKFIPYEHE